MGDEDGVGERYHETVAFLGQRRSCAADVLLKGGGSIRFAGTCSRAAG